MADRLIQRDEVWDFIEKRGSITQRQAEDCIGCMRLASRIDELRKMGKPIKTEMIPKKNRWKRTVYVARYVKGA